MELGAGSTAIAGNHRLGAISAHHGWIVDLGIFMANDLALVGNCRVGGLDAVTCLQFN